MRKWKQLACVSLLTTLLIGLGLVDGGQLFTGSTDSQMGEAEISSSAAMAAVPTIKFRKAQYDDDGLLIGCFDTGKNCIVIGLDVAGTQRELLVTANTVMLN